MKLKPQPMLGGRFSSTPLLKKRRKLICTFLSYGHGFCRNITYGPVKAFMNILNAFWGLKGSIVRPFSSARLSLSDYRKLINISTTKKIIMFSLATCQACVSSPFLTHPANEEKNCFTDSNNIDI